MPCIVNFSVSVKKKADGAALNISVDADGSGDFDAAERFALFAVGRGTFERQVQIAANAPQGVAFVLLVNANPGATITLSATDAQQNTLLTTKAYTVPSTGKTWIAGHI